MSYEKNLILSIENIGLLGYKNNELDKYFESETEEIGDQRVSRELLQIIFKVFGKIANIQYQFGDTSASIRFDVNSKEATAKALAAFESKPLILGKKVAILNLITGQKEQLIYAHINKGQTARKEKYTKKRGARQLKNKE
ncbi:RNA binding motif-containing protein [Spironucleus salmonicida]|uniref:RNA binding motif-containing protein n=1 Tax=Spironucleus salmonicida TaxID=348837 RepID=V6LAT3_9EUKA|nr:RNA binding motif-containing protein [Spironucleus salmonicida]|eukprot:EST41333.1 RNA binding motif-containing protein [Spironucleus salmonicida]